MFNLTDFLEIMHLICKSGYKVSDNILFEFNKFAQDNYFFESLNHYQRSLTLNILAFISYK